MYKNCIPLLIVQLFCILSCAQNKNTEEQEASPNSYVVDKERKLILWHHKASKELATKKQSIKFKDIGVFHSTTAIQPENPVVQNGYTLYSTTLPIIHIKIKDSITDEPKKPATFTYYSNNKTISETIGIELRGNISQTFLKKTYDIEFWEDQKGTQNKDVQFKDLRSDDDWILDGIYNEPLRLRSFIASKLWLAIHKPYYASVKPKAKSGIDLFYVEVFINNAYKGLFTFSEQVDENLLKLKDPDDNDNLYGSLYKASGYKGATMFQKLPDYENIFPHWGGYEMEFPIINYNYYWDDLYAFTDFVLHASAQDFNNHIDTKIDLDNTIDYYLFMNLLRATDNLGKNYYIAKHDKNTPYFLIPWDLDGVLGTIIDGRHIATTDDILSNGLFDRLLKDNPKNYRERLKSRWQDLRQQTLNHNNILASIDKWYTRFDAQRIYQREALLYTPKISQEEQLNYLKQWLEKRLLFLDDYFINL